MSTYHPSSNILSGTFTGSGNASTTVYTVSHGLTIVPSSFNVTSASPQARGTPDISGNASGLIVTFPVAPSSGNVILKWSVFP